MNETPLDQLIDAHIRATLEGEIALDVWNTQEPTLALLTKRKGQLVSTIFGLPHFPEGFSDSYPAQLAMTYSFVASTDRVPQVVSDAIDEAEELCGLVCYSEAFGMKIESKTLPDMGKLREEIAKIGGIQNHPDVLDVKLATIVWGRYQFDSFGFERGSGEIQHANDATGPLAIAMGALFAHLQEYARAAT